MKSQQRLKPVPGMNGKQSYSPIENSIDLSEYVQFETSRSVGAALLTKKEIFHFRFGFSVKGIHPLAPEDVIESTFDNIESGLKSLPPGEFLTIEYSSFTDDKDRQRQLDELFQIAPLNTLAALVMSEKARVQSLTHQGIRKPKKLRFYVSVTIDQSTVGSEDFIEAAIQKTMSFLGNKWMEAINEDGRRELERLGQIFRSALAGYQQWQQILTTQMGFDIKPLSAQELWEIQWREFNDSPPRPIPQLLTWDGKRLSYQHSTTDHISTAMFESPREVPVADPKWTYVKGNYDAVLAFEYLPGGWDSKRAELKYLWESLSGELVSDIKVITTLCLANASMINTNLQRLDKQAMVARKKAAEEDTNDVRNSMRSQAAQEAQERMFAGEVPLKISTVVIVRRGSPADLQDACGYLENSFNRPAGLVVESEYAWRTWLQCQPHLTLERPLFHPFQRQKTMLCGDAIGLCPVVSTKTVDSFGVELIADDSGTPLHIDLFKRHRNVLLCGTTRSGKSVLVSMFLTHCLINLIPIVAIDFPKEDGSSTFSTYTELMGDKGAYFDITKESNNLFELPDFSGLSDAQRDDRLNDIKAFLLNALMILVVGAESGDVTPQIKLMRQNIRTLLSYCLNRYFEDSSIQGRYAQALEKGIDTEEWANSPTMKDFRQFCTAEIVGQTIALTDDLLSALSSISMRLNYWIESPIGKAIAEPTTFRADAMLLVFALKGLNDGEDAAVMALSCYSAAMRRTLEYPASVFFIDEAPILFKYEEIASLVGRMCANGAKSGVRVIISAQDPQKIYQTKGSEDIFPNLSTQLIGRIEAAALDNFETILKIPRSIIARNASDSFFPKREGIYSQWLLCQNGTYTTCRFYAPLLQLAAVANNPDEAQIREQFMERYPDPIEALVRFSEELASALQQNRKLQGPPQVCLMEQRQCVNA